MMAVISSGVGISTPTALLPLLDAPLSILAPVALEIPDGVASRQPLLLGFGQDRAETN
jgi:hypothetical protein